MTPRRNLLRWLGWFSVAVFALACLIGLRYLFVYAFPSDLLGVVYALAAFLGQFAVLAFVPLFVLLAPLILLWPQRAVVMAAAVILSAAGLSLLLLDTNVFAEYRFHLTRLTMALFEPGTWLLTGIVFMVLLALLAMVAGAVWRSAVVAGRWRFGRSIAASLAGCWLVGTGLHIWGDAVAYTPVTQFTRFLPLYYPIHAKRDLARLGLVDPEAVRQQRLLRGSIDTDGGQLRYPLNPLQCNAPENPPSNLLLILIDALRPDVVVPELMPNLVAFRDGAQEFASHYSGGNSSRMGVFSMFYGLPTTYWQSFYDLQRPPVLIDQLGAADYTVALFAASGFGSPTLIDRTVFAGFADVPDEDKSESATNRNIAVTDDWLEWFAAHAETRPFFGFLYYDPPMGDMPESGPPLPLDARVSDNQDAVTRWHQYRLAMQLMDGEVERVLDSLRASGRLDDTVVVIASDHGYEFDDNGLGYIGHAGNFSDAQLQSTLYIHWPGRTPTRFEHRTSHHDLPVTLLQDLLGCRNPVEDFAVGNNLFSGESWDWITAGSYSAHAIVQPDRVIVSNPGGLVEVLGPNYRPERDVTLDAGLIQESMLQMRRFYR